MSNPASRRRRTWAAVTAAVALAVAAIGPVPAARAASFDATIADAQAGIAEAVEAGSVDSISVSVTGTDGLIWAGAGGTAGARGEQASTATTYGIGSVSKLFATAAIMQLVEQGRVALDRPVVEYLPEFRMRSPQFRQITVRMLLNHSAGFPGADYTNAFLTKPWDGYAAQVLATLSRARLKTTPGALSVYCNDCFTVAGEVVAAVSGVSFPDYVRRHILAPLGMTSSRYATQANGAPATIARTLTDGRVRPVEFTTVYASGGLVSTPTDMAAFARMLLGEGSTAGASVLQPRSVAEMGRSQVDSTFLPVSVPYQKYGLGWDGVEFAPAHAVGVRAWEKNGATADYHSDFIVAPEAGIAVFVNAAGTNPAIDNAVAAVAKRVFLHALVDAGVIDEMPSMRTEQPASEPASDADVDAMLGTYLGSRGMSFRVGRGAGDALQVDKLTDGRWAPFMEVTHRSDGSWWATNEAMQALHTVTGWGRRYLVVELDMGNGLMSEIVFAHRMTPSRPTNRAWRPLLGEWLMVKARPTSTAWEQSPATLLAAVPGLDGYLDFGGYPVDARAAGIATMFIQVPMAFGRDQRDLELTRSGTLLAGNDVFVRRATVPAMPRGASTVRIRRDGYAQWRTVPRAGRVTVAGASHWKVYDADATMRRAGRGPATGVPVPAGGLLLVLSHPGRQVDLSYRPTPRVRWQACADTALRGFQCGTLRVPKDYRDAAAGTLRLALVRHRATGTPAQRIGSLVYNPGGPGGSGLATMPATWQELPAGTQRRYDLVSWDPRGIGASSGLQGCPFVDWSLPATGPVDWTAVLADNRAKVREANAACVAANPDIAASMGTMNTVRDLESIRRALGQRRLTFWGMSYGTRIGYSYALSYPRRVARVVLDGVTSPRSSIASFFAGYNTAADSALTVFFQQYPAGLRHYRQARASLARQPLTLPGGRQFTRWDLGGLMDTYAQWEENYATLDDSLAAVVTAITGHGAARRRALATVAAAPPLPQIPATGAAIITCQDYPDRPTAAEQDALAARARLVAPITGWLRALETVAACEGIDLPADPVPTTFPVNSRTRMLLLGATRDAQTPYVWTTEMASAFRAARTVTYVGSKHLTFATIGSGCVDSHVQRFLLAGRLPRTDVACPNVRA